MEKAVDLTDMPLDKRMELNGYIVTDKKWGGWDNGNRMITDSEGNEVGFMTPMECIAMLKEKEV